MGIEPMTARITTWSSTNWAIPTTVWWLLLGSNQWPLSCKESALPTELSNLEILLDLPSSSPFLLFIDLQGKRAGLIKNGWMHGDLTHKKAYLPPCFLYTVTFTLLNIKLICRQTKYDRTSRFSVCGISACTHFFISFEIMCLLTPYGNIIFCAHIKMWLPNF